MSLPEVWNTKQFEANLRYGLQVEGTLLESSVMVSSAGFGGAEYKFIDFIDDDEVIEITSRLGNTQWKDTSGTRRRIAKRYFAYNKIFDTFEKLNRLCDPTSSEMQQAIWAHGRNKDQRIIEAFDGTVYSGKEGATAITFDSNQIVDSTGASGMTLDKLKETLYLFNKNKINPMEKKYFAVGAKQIDDMLGITQITSADYNTIRTLTEGKIASFLGFNFIFHPELGTDSNSDRECFAWTQNAIELCQDLNMVTTLDRLPMMNNNYGLICQSAFGAARTDELRVVKILCQE